MSLESFCLHGCVFVSICTTSTNSGVLGFLFDNMPCMVIGNVFDFNQRGVVCVCRSCL